MCGVHDCVSFCVGVHVCMYLYIVTEKNGIGELAKCFWNCFGIIPALFECRHIISKYIVLHLHDRFGPLQQMSSTALQTSSASVVTQDAYA